MFEVLQNWVPPAHWQRITTLDVHTAGEPLRIVTGGLPKLPGNSILECRRYLKTRLDTVRRLLMWEPRGHREMYGCVLTPPFTPEAEFGAIFMHNEGYSTMCGHAIIGLAKTAVEMGMVPIEEPETTIGIDTPAGHVTARVRVSGGTIQNVSFYNVPSFVVALDETIEVPGLGPIRYDLAFGGAFYAYVQADQLGLSCTPEENFQLVQRGMEIKRAIMANRPIVHPFEKDLSFLYGTIFIAPPRNMGADSRNVCIFAEGEVDRSPTGTGVSGRMAIHYARGEIKLDQPMVIESIVDSRFTGRVAETTRFGPYPAVVPKIEGTAHITGRHEFYIDPDDPLTPGFLIA